MAVEEVRYECIEGQFTISTIARMDSEAQDHLGVERWEYNRNEAGQESGIGLGRHKVTMTMARAMRAKQGAWSLRLAADIASGSLEEKDNSEGESRRARQTAGTRTRRRLKRSAANKQGSGHGPPSHTNRLCDGN